MQQSTQQKSKITKVQLHFIRLRNDSYSWQVEVLVWQAKVLRNS